MLLTLVYGKYISRGFADREEAANDIEMGDKVEVDFTTGVITNHTKNKTYQAEPFPEFMQEMFKVGGLVEQTKVKLGLK